MTMPSEKKETGDSRLQRWGLLGVASLAILAGLSGCDWLFGSSSSTSERARPGAERQFGAGTGLPGASTGHQYDAGIAPADETRGGSQVGSVVRGSGGQKAQLDAAAKEAAERDAKSRETRAREQRETELKKGREANTTPPPAPIEPAPAVEPPAQSPPASTP